MKEQQLKQLLNKNKRQSEDLQKENNRISRWRLILALAAMVALGVAFFEFNLLAGLLGMGLVAAFIWCVKKHNHVGQKQRYVEREREVLERYLARRDDRWKEFEEIGLEWLDVDYPPARDLDLIGKDSLYQYICVANTSYGKGNLASRLQQKEPNLEELAKVQEAVGELGNKEKFSCHMQALSRLMIAENTKKKEKGIGEFIRLVEEDEVTIAKGVAILMWVMPVFTLGLLVMTILQGGQGLAASMLTLSIVAQLIIVNARRVKNHQLLDHILAFERNVEPYLKMVEAINEEKFKSTYLKEVQQKIAGETGALTGLKKLAVIGQRSTIRYNGIGHFIYNGMLMWDYHLVNQFGQWQKQYGRELTSWLIAIGEMEALLSLAILCQGEEEHSFPTVVEQDKPLLVAKQVKHPLIQQAIANSIKLEGQTCLITGSNMSGKTTFMRSIGTSLALAYAGGPVLAKEFTVSKMAMFTSMRVEDSVSKGLSTFYAELLRIKDMVDYSDEQKPMITLIDEIFKGTNSKDRIVGATETVKRLSNPWAIAVVTTHDFELCNLEQDPQIGAVNYHFEEYYIDDEIKFDYTIKAGRSRTTNAQHLLRMVGIMR